MFRLEATPENFIRTMIRFAPTPLTVANFLLWDLEPHIHIHIDFIFHFMSQLVLTTSPLEVFSPVEHFSLYHHLGKLLAVFTFMYVSKLFQCCLGPG